MAKYTSGILLGSEFLILSSSRCEVLMHQAVDEIKSSERHVVDGHTLVTKMTQTVQVAFRTFQRYERKILEKASSSLMHYAHLSRP